jgi:uncharacterized protein YggE
VTEPDASRWISVVATGAASIAPDLAVVSFAVSGTGKELAPTRDEVNRRSSAVLAAVRELGIGEADLNAPDLALGPEYDYRKGQRLIGYRATRQMTARVRDLDLLGPVQDALTSAGANEVHGARMEASDPSAAEHQALAAAMNAAHAKAEVLAAAAGTALGSVVRVEEEADLGPPMPKLAMMQTADTGGMPTETVTGDLTVSRRIRAWFAIE